VDITAFGGRSKSVLRGRSEKRVGIRSEGFGLAPNSSLLAPLVLD
jgi:hypothetical protein